MTFQRLFMASSAVVGLGTGYLLYSNSREKSLRNGRVSAQSAATINSAKPDVDPLKARTFKALLDEAGINDSKFKSEIERIKANNRLYRCKCLDESYCRPFDFKNNPLARLTVKEGKFVWDDDKSPIKSYPTYHCEECTFEISEPNGTIAILKTGEVVASPYVVNHCRLTRQENVLFAGEFKGEGGKIVMLNRQSGHYQPGTEALTVALEIFKLYGIDTDGITVDQIGNLR